MTTEAKKSYKQTLNLPQTAFPMEAKLVANEPGRLKKWQDADLYGQIMAARKDAPKWVLHDGPPFANGDIHIGHVINHVLKDVVIRFKTMQGFNSPYVPGWDCHGLPIEHKIQQEIGPKIREMPPEDLRKMCHDYAQKFIDIQRMQIQRLGMLGDWQQPYVTMSKRYEASQLEVFAKLVEAGLVFKKLRPVPWSTVNQTALAEHELEYQDRDDPSIYVEFASTNPGQIKSLFDARLNAPVNFLVWTTTPWTLPANLAIAVHPEQSYVMVKFARNGQTRIGVVVEPLVEKVFKDRKGIDAFETIGKSVRGSALVAAGVEYAHPFIPRTGKILGAMYVTTEDGTGLVHTAPAHGVEDYATGQAHGLPPTSPVLGNGRYDDTAPDWLVSKTVWDANPLIVDQLRGVDALFDVQTIRHSYPHDWRSKTPVIQRAAEQWFIGMDKPFTTAADPQGLSPKTLRERALNAIQFDVDQPQTQRQRELAAEIERDERELYLENQAALRRGEQGEPLTKAGLQKILKDDPLLDINWNWVAKDAVSFTPSWGRNRLRGMMENRPDWSISRQRFWGLPIPVFYNEQSEPLITPESVRAVAKQFAEHGSDAWFTQSPKELLGSDFVLPAGFQFDSLRKEQDTFDVGLDSGTSWHDVLYHNPSLTFPAQLYLEGSDQHRLWFQLSLLASLGATGKPPFQRVLTHGFVVKPDGTKVSKSDKEYVTATKEIDTHGADLLRLWCCSIDYENDIPTSPKTIKEFGDKYRKIRNTLRYLLSNLYDFDPFKDTQTIPLNSLDGWAHAEVDVLIRETIAAYDAFSFHRAFRLLHDFCAVQISAQYGNAMKDRLYCEMPNSPLRRRAQTVMHRMLDTLVRLLAPMIVFTSDETWEYVKGKADAEAFSVHLAKLPAPSAQVIGDVQRAEWETLWKLRDSATIQLDELKKAVGLNKAIDAEVVYQFDAETGKRFAAYGVDLEDIVGAGFHRIEDAAADAVTVIDTREKYPACARSWKRRPDVGSDPNHPELCARDAAAVSL